jgi:hypothetical protein
VVIRETEGKKTGHGKKRRKKKWSVIGTGRRGGGGFTVKLKREIREAYCVPHVYQTGNDKLLVSFFLY